MDTLLESLSNNGFRAVHENLDDGIIDIKVKNIMFSCKENNKDVYIFTDLYDISLLREYNGLSENKDTIGVVMWNDGKENNVYYVSKSFSYGVKMWNLIFTKGISNECCICLEEFERGKTPDVMCPSCLATRCRYCTWKQHTPECPMCREFDTDSYINKRLRCMYIIITHAGITQEIINEKRTYQGKINECERYLNASMLREHELYTGKVSNFIELMKRKICKENIDEYIDFEMLRCGENTYDIKDKVKYNELLPVLLDMGKAWEWKIIHEVVNE